MEATDLPAAAQRILRAAPDATVEINGNTIVLTLVGEWSQEVRFVVYEGKPQGGMAFIGQRSYNVPTIKAAATLFRALAKKGDLMQAQDTLDTACEVL